MQKPVPEDYPITGICVVQDPQKCPPGYELIYRSHDKRDDCDLWKDSFFKASITRYLCITRVFPLDSGRLNNVMEDIVIRDERDLPPPGYSQLEKTIDTSDKATRKKHVCVKMSPRDSTNSAIIELIILSRSKRPPPGYTLVGEINGLLVCFKMGPVPPETQKTSQDTNSAPLQEERVMKRSASKTSTEASSIQSEVSGMTNHAPVVPTRPFTRQASVLLPNQPLSGVEFKLNPKFVDAENMNHFTVPEIHFRSLVDIENEYNYPFTLERQAEQAQSLRNLMQ